MHQNSRTFSLSVQFCQTFLTSFYCFLVTCYTFNFISFLHFFIFLFFKIFFFNKNLISKLFQKILLLEDSARHEDERLLLNSTLDSKLNSLSCLSPTFVYQSIFYMLSWLQSFRFSNWLKFFAFEISKLLLTVSL